MFVAMGALSLAIIHELVELKIDVVTGAQEHVQHKKNAPPKRGTSGVGDRDAEYAPIAPGRM